MKTEAELAAAVSAWLRGDGWRTYHEVPLAAGRIDIVAVRGGRLVWAIETKLRAGLDVLEQALERRRSGASAVLVACPSTRSTAFLTVADKLGIGVIDVDDDRHVRLRAWPECHRHAKAEQILAALRPEQEHQAAGKPGGEPYWTPFKSFVRDVVEVVAKMDRPVPLAEAVALEAVTRYKPTHKLPQLKRYLVWVIDAGLAPGLALAGEGKARTVVFDRKAVTAEQRRDYQLRL